MTKSFPTREDAVDYVTLPHSEVYADERHYSVVAIEPIRITQVGQSHWWVVADVFSTHASMARDPHMGSELGLWHVWEAYGEWHARSWGTDRLYRYDCQESLIKGISVDKRWKERRKQWLLTQGRAVAVAAQ